MKLLVLLFLLVILCLLFFIFDVMIIRIRSEYAVERTQLTDSYFVNAGMRCSIRYPNDPQPQNWKTCCFYTIGQSYNSYTTDIRCENQAADYWHRLANRCYALNMGAQSDTCTSAVSFWNQYQHVGGIGNGVSINALVGGSYVPICPPPFVPDLINRDCKRRAGQAMIGYGSKVENGYFTQWDGQRCGSAADCQNIAPGAICAAGGYCSCDSSPAGREKSCNYAGYCVDRSPGNGRCECWPDVPSNAITVQGNPCEINLKNIINTLGQDTQIKLCNNFGIPYCRGGDFPFPPPADRQILQGISTVGYYCNQGNFAKRGMYSCLCDTAHRQDFPDPNNPNNPALSASLCVNAIPCLASVSFEIPAGICHCKNQAGMTDLYRHNITGSIPIAFTCQPNCKVDRCTSHGTCIFTPALSPTILDPHTNDCTCDADWMAYKFASTDYSIRNLEYDNPVALRCNWPRNRYLSKDICGEYAEPYDPCFVSGGCVYSPQTDRTPQCQKLPANDPVIVNLALAGKIIEKNALGIWVEVCGTTENIQCGGSRRGVCVQIANSVYAKCNCKNGYSGVGCQNVHCPLMYNMICAGNGMCDMITGHCVCNAGFLGRGCELWNHNKCFNGQLIHVNPGPGLIVTTMDT